MESEKCDSSSSTTSRSKTVKSQSSSVAKLQEQAKVGKQISDLNKHIIQCKASIEVAKIDLEAAEFELEELWKEHDNLIVEDEDAAAEIEELIKITTRQIRNLKYELKKVEQEENEKILNAQASIKSAQANLKTVIQSNASEKDDDESSFKSVQDWVDKSQPIGAHETKSIVSSGFTTEMEQRLEALKSIEKSSRGQDKPPMNPELPIPSQPSPITQSNPDIAQAIMALAKSLESQQSQSTTTKFMARQTTGKDLPIFAGQPEEWPAFIASYIRTTELCSFSDAENMERLRKCLKGEAKKSVECLMVSPNNLQEVMKTLEQRFGSKKHVIQALIKKAQSVPPVRSDKPQTFIDFGTAVVNLSATVMSLKADAYLKNPQLILELEKKLPFSMRREWEVWKSTTLPTGEEDLNMFSIWVKSELRMVYNMNDNYVPPPSNEKGKKPHHHDKKKGKENGEWVFNVDVKEGGKERKKKCFHCNSNEHILCHCDDFKAKSVDERRELVKNKGLCFNCMDISHEVKKCESKNRCRKSNCGRKHHTLLHFENHNAAQSQREKATDNANPSEESVNAIHESGQGQELKGILGMIEVKLTGPHGSVTGYAMVDGGSTTSLISPELAEVLGMKGYEKEVCFNALGSERTSTSKVGSVFISGTFTNSKKYELKAVKTLPDFNLGILSVNLDDLTKEYPYLADLPLKSYNQVKPMILIGSGGSYLTEPLRVVGRKPEEPRAYMSRLGWYVTGSRELNNRIDSEISFHICEHDQELHELVKENFSTESFGVKVTEKPLRSKQDERALQILQSTTRKLENEHRYESGLLWRSDDIKLPSSKKNALLRLGCQERKMDRDPLFAEAYILKMKEYEDKGFIIKLQEDEAESVTDRTWYLPHFGVLNPNKPGKLRLVFDAAAETNGTSLNKALLKGPDLNNTIYSVLARFRQYRFAFTGDVKDMFHRVIIREEDRASQRFLWRGESRSEPPSTYEMQVAIFGSSCSPTIAQYVKNHNADNYCTEFPEACSAIKEQFYVDDYTDSTPKEEDGVKRLAEVIAVMEKGGFELCNVTSNSKLILNSIPDEKRTKELKNLDLNDGVIPTGRLLGQWWDPEEDEFTYRLGFHKIPPKIITGEKWPTKRDLLKVVMSLYDPLGLVAHLIVKGKILLQDVWRAGVGFDDEIPQSSLGKWNQFLHEIQNLTKVRIPRCYSIHIPMSNNIQLHIFTDASEKSFAAVGYLRTVKAEDDGESDVNIIGARTRVTPLKPLSIPRLELQGAILGVRVAKAFKESVNIPIHQTIYWTDSKTVLAWLRNDARKFKQFVSHRIGEILDSSDVTDWRWVPTQQNTADDATRDNEESDLTPNSRWFRGPEFLRMQADQWPSEFPTNEEEIDFSEMKPNEEFVFHLAEKEKVDDGLTFKNYEKLNKLLRVTSYFLMCAKAWKKKEKVDWKITVDRMEEATEFWVRKCQKESFAWELQLLNGGKPLPRTSRLHKLDLILDNGIMKKMTRLQEADVPHEMKCPVVLDGKHHFTQTLINHYHRDFGHQGTETVVNALQQKYWITSIKQTVKKVSRNCPFCKIRRSLPSPLIMGNLPRARLDAHTQPFKHTGMDYFGPFKVKVGRKHEKRWGVIFTCMSTRAIHLEIAGSLTTDSCIMAMRRFANRRGDPAHIYCDNGSNFHGAEEELKRALADVDIEKINNSLVSKGIRWHYNPPASPHFGGAWERLVGSVKVVLRGLLNDRLHIQTEETMMTFYTEVERIINSRPLTSVSIDPNDPMPLTPNHFLLGWRSGYDGCQGQFPEVIGKFEESDIWLRKQWRQAQRMADDFWGKWVKYYLPHLARRAKWHKTGRQLKVGDLVVIADDKAPRNTWTMGRVVAVYPGPKDGIVRVADVKTAHGIYRRSASKLCILDLADDDDEEQENLDQSKPEENQDQSEQGDEY